MKLFRLKKHHIAIGSIFLVLVVLGVFINSILSHSIEKKIKQNSTSLVPNYRITVENVRANIFLGNIKLSGINLTPDSLILENIEAKKELLPTTLKIEMDGFSLAGIKMIKALTKQQVEVDRIELNKPIITILKGNLNGQVANTQKVFHPDSIQINGIAGFIPGKIVITEPSISVIDLSTEKTQFSFSNSKTVLNGIKLSELADVKALFQLDLTHFTAELHEGKVALPGGDYNLNLNTMKVDAINRQFDISNLELKPVEEDLSKFAKKLHYTSEMYDLSVQTIKLKNFNISESLRLKNLFLDSLNISGLNFAILMDKAYPFNTSKRPKLPNQTLKNMSFPLYIGSLNITNSNLLYQEKMPGIKDPMTVSLNNLNTSISRITSVKDSLKIRKNMKLQIRCDFMKETKMEVDFVFPLYMRTDTFFYSGLIGKAKLPLFNQATFPALGARFTDGTLKSIRFKGSANTHINSGQMTMLYSGLKAEVVRKDHAKKNNLSRWPLIRLYIIQILEKKELQELCKCEQKGCHIKDSEILCGKHFRME